MTDGGTDPTSAPQGADTPWPAPPAGNWGTSPSAVPSADPTPSSPPTSTAAPTPASTPAGSAPRPPRKRRVVEMAVVVALTGAIVAIAFTLVDGDSKESAAKSKFTTVGNSIDSGSSSGGFSTIPMDEDSSFPTEDADEPRMDGLFAALPVDDEVEDLIELTRGQVTMGLEEEVPPGPAKAYCTDEAATAVDGARRAWTGADDAVEVEVSIVETASPDDAAAAVKSRQTDEFLACIPDAVYPSLLGQGLSGAQMTDSAAETTGDQLEQAVLVEGLDDGGLYVWRQVDQYVVSVKVFDFDYEDGADLQLNSADELLSLTTELLPN